MLLTVTSVKITFRERKQFWFWGKIIFIADAIATYSIGVQENYSFTGNSPQDCMGKVESFINNQVSIGKWDYPKIKISMSDQNNENHDTNHSKKNTDH
jgi:hypothetical protein